MSGNSPKMLCSFGRIPPHMWVRKSPWKRCFPPRFRPEMCPSVGKALTESHLTSIAGGPDALSLLVMQGCNRIQLGCLSRGTAAQEICRPMGNTTAVFSSERKTKRALLGLDTHLLRSPPRLRVSLAPPYPSVVSLPKRKKEAAPPGPPPDHYPQTYDKRRRSTSGRRSPVAMTRDHVVICLHRRSQHPFEVSISIGMDSIQPIIPASFENEVRQGK